MTDGKQRPIALMSAPRPDSTPSGLAALARRPRKPPKIRTADGRAWHSVLAPRYRSVVKAERFVIKALRASRRPRDVTTIADARERSSRVEARLASDLVLLAAAEIPTVVLLVGGEPRATAVGTVRELGASLLVRVPAGCGALVAQSLREAATRVIGRQAAIFEPLLQVRAPRADARSSRGSATGGGTR